VTRPSFALLFAISASEKCVRGGRIHPIQSQRQIDLYTGSIRGTKGFAQLPVTRPARRDISAEEPLEQSADVTVSLHHQSCLIAPICFAR
jgi:hypothetical protein